MSGRDLSRISFLIVDDNEFSRVLIRTMLRGLRVRTLREASDGSAALELLRREPMDIVLCDYDMKPMSGLDFIRAARSDRDNVMTNIPIIMLTAYSSQKDVVESRDAGVSDYLIKPFSVRTLADRIVHVIDHPRLFVTAETYRGPDRRHRAQPTGMGPRRRSSDNAKLNEND